LALVRLRRTEVADLRRDLTEELAIAARQRQDVLVDLGADRLRQIEHHRVREAEREGDLLPRHLGAITDAVDLELLLEPDGDALGDEDRFTTYARHGYHTSQMSSPPRPALRAARSVIRPCDVVRTEMPRPERTFGRSSLLTYLRCPGRDTRLSPWMAFLWL